MSGADGDVQLAEKALDACDSFLAIADLSDPKRAARLNILRDLFAEHLDDARREGRVRLTPPSPGRVLPG